MFALIWFKLLLCLKEEYRIKHDTSPIWTRAVSSVVFRMNYDYTKWILTFKKVLYFDVPSLNIPLIPYLTFTWKLIILKFMFLPEVSYRKKKMISIRIMIATWCLFLFFFVSLASHVICLLLVVATCGMVDMVISTNIIQNWYEVVIIYCPSSISKMCFLNIVTFLWKENDRDMVLFLVSLVSCAMYLIAISGNNLRQGWTWWYLWSRIGMRWLPCISQAVFKYLFCEHP